MLKRCCAVIVIFILLSTMLTGCWDSSEVDDNVYAVTIGLDKGENNKVVVTIQYPTYNSSNGGQNEGGGNFGGGNNVESMEAPALLEAIDLINMSVSRRVSLLHTKMLVISEDFARQGIGAFLSPLARFRGTRRTMFVVVTKGKARDFIMNNNTDIGRSITKTIELMIAQSKNTGFFPYLNFHTFYKNIISTYGDSVAIYAGINDFESLRIKEGKKKSPLIVEKDLKPGQLPRIGTSKTEFVGTALFNGDRMVGSFNPYETRYMLMLQGKFKSGIMTIEDDKAPGDGIIVSLRPGRPIHIKGRFQYGKPVVDIVLNMEADIGAIHSRINYERVGLIENLNKQLEQRIKKEVELTIDKAKNQYKTDVFQFGKKFAGYFPTVQEWEKYDWAAHFPETKVNLSVKVNVRRTGLMIKSTPVNK